MRSLVLTALFALAGCAATPRPSPTLPPVGGASAPVGMDPKSPAAALDVVRRYYAAIGTRDYRRAYALWGDEGRRSGQTFERFQAGFAETARVAVEVSAATEGDAGAGSVFVTVPVVVRAQTAGGAEQVFTGTYVLRRVNDVDGATPAQLAWHIESADLRPAP